MTDVSQALSLVDEMKRRGVRRFEVPGVVSAEFEPPREAPLKPDAKRADPEQCACGHAMHAHVNGLCTANDCGPEKCIPREEQ